MAKNIKNNSVEESNEVYSCLRNERVIVRFVPRDNDNIKDRKHVAYGGMMENSIRGFTVPMLSNGTYRNVLTDNEKKFLEVELGLEDNALSVYNKKNNYWDNYLIKLRKEDNILDLSTPDGYIAYKVLLANKDTIAPSLKTLRDNYKATYQYVIMEQNEDFVDSKNKVSNLMRCYEEFGAIKDKFDVIKYVVEAIEGRPVSATSKIEFVQSRVTDIINNNPKKFLDIVTDELIKVKVLIKNAVTAGVISKRGDFYYLREDGSPLCSNGEDPTFSIAAKYLSLPQNQELRFSIEAKVNK